MSDTITFKPFVAHTKTAPLRIALAGNPNSGKTTLFNDLTGLRAKTANFPGTTVEVKVGQSRSQKHVIQLIDLPGLYSLNPSTPDEQIAADVIMGRVHDFKHLDAVIVVADATKLERHLFLASQIIEQNIPVIVALNMMDLADKQGLQIDVDALAAELRCPVIPVSARLGTGVNALTDAMAAVVRKQPPELAVQLCQLCATCPFQSRFSWSMSVCSRCVRTRTAIRHRRTERLDHALTHPVWGVAAFMAVMLFTFAMIFHVASVPMDLIDALFASAGATLARVLPDGQLQSLLVNGVVAGVGGILVFLPQICILFFALSLLEDTGYLARAAFVMDRLMRRIGLPGKAFVPLLASHACAIPGIMATRVIEDRRDRLITILVAPLMSCSARIPIYTMIIALLFPHQPFRAAALFTGSYLLGILAALGVAGLFRRTILKGEVRPLVMELPDYRWPSLKTATLHMLDRAGVFVKQAGTLILLASMALWFLASYPRMDAAPHPTSDTVVAEADQLAHSYAGRVGRWMEPVIRPLGFDWQIGIGILSSFAAREVIVSTLAIVYGIGSDDAESESLYDALRRATRADGTAVFTTATCLSLLVFYILSSQCLATLIITRRETGSWRWPLLQFTYMTTLAYLAAFLVYQLASRLA